jgi:hypothetical protein
MPDSTEPSFSDSDNPWEPSPAVLPLELDLTELPFHLPLTCETLHFLTLANPNPGPIIFRVQTTHYDNYTVSPSFGRIEAGEELEVVITIYPKTNPAFNEEHKFKFKSVAVKEKETAPLETHDQAVEYFRAWEEDPEKKGLVQKSRIRSVFVPEDEPEVSVKLEKIEE